MAPDVPPFDTQQEAARLGDAGFHQQQADAIVGTVRRAVANLVTKEDLDEALAGLKTSVEADINRQTTALKDEIHKAITDSSRQTTALKDEIHKAITDSNRQTTALKDEIHKAITDSNRQTTALKDEIHKAITDSNRQTTALKDEIHKAVTGIHKTETGIHRTETDIHKAIADIHKAINGQTWRYVAFTGTLLAVQTAVLLGLVRLLIPTS